jgi:hypothetical protein
MILILAIYTNNLIRIYNEIKKKYKHKCSNLLILIEI